MNLLQQLKSYKQRGKQGFSDSKEDTIKKIKINIKNNDFSITYKSGRHRQFYKIIAHLSNIHLLTINPVFSAGFPPLPLPLPNMMLLFLDFGWR